MLKSFSSPGDKQVLPDAIAKTDWTKCAICQQNKVESVPFGFQALVWCWIRVQDLAWKYSKVQGSRFQAYADRSFTARWKGEELERNTLVRCKARWHKVAMISSILGSYNEQKQKNMRLKVNNRFIGGKCSIHVQLRLHFSTIVLHAFLCGEYSTRKNPLHNVSTFSLDARVRKCATALRDWWRAFGEVKRDWLVSAGG